jgi:hypothetical protein
VPFSAGISRSIQLSQKCRLACATCKWSVSVALVTAGLILMALATFALVVSFIWDWQSGWIARLVGLIVLCSVPFVLTFVVRDFLESRNEEGLQTRLAWAGAFAIFLGVLELILGIASLLIAWVFSSMVNH